MVYRVRDCPENITGGGFVGDGHPHLPKPHWGGGGGDRLVKVIEGHPDFDQKFGKLNMQCTV